MILKNVVPSKLHQELINAGIECSLFHILEDGRYSIGECEIKFAEGTDMGLVQQIIDAHDPTPLPIPKTYVEILQLENTLLKEQLEVSTGAIDFIIMNF